MKELHYSHQERKGFWRKATAIIGGAALLTACEQQPEITEGTIYKKEHTKAYQALVGKILLSREEKDKEVGSIPLIHEERGESKEWISNLTFR
jgi:hypothetical protein